MKITELRIGNLVLFDGEILPVCSLHDDNTLRLLKNGKSIGCFSIEAVMPIPITPEILEKSGFTKGEVNIMSSYMNPKGEKEPCYWNGNGFVLIRPEQNTFVGRKYLGDQLQDTFFSTVIFYVHQLQNYFPAFNEGRELEIKL